jgi:hypothetical protein
VRKQGLIISFGLAIAGCHEAPIPEGTSAEAIASQTVFFRAINGQYVVAEGAGGQVVNANRSGAGPWETFSLIDIGGGRNAIRTADGVHYWRALGGGGAGLDTQATAIGAWEQFTVVNLGGGNVALQTINGHYVVAEGGGGGVVNANRTGIGAWETFAMIGAGSGCGNGVCNLNETCQSCNSDCNCPNGYCVVPPPGNGGPYCRNVVCGDGTCEGELFGEDCGNCPQDCGGC